MFLTHSWSRLPGVYLSVELGFLLANIRHNHSFEEKPRKNFNKSEGRYSVHNISVPNNTVNRGKHRIYTCNFKGCWVFFVTARLLLLSCYYYGIYVYKQCNYCYRNPLQFPTQLVSPCVPTTQNWCNHGFKQGYWDWLYCFLSISVE